MNNRNYKIISIFSFVNRTCIQECEIDGVKFEPGVQVSIPIWAIHHDPEVWQYPDNFEPERYDAASLSYLHNFQLKLNSSKQFSKTKGDATVNYKNLLEAVCLY